MVKYSPSRQCAQTLWARSRSSSLAAVLRALKTSAQVPGTQNLLRSCAKALQLFVHIDETQSFYVPFDLYIMKFAVFEE